jgi:hypothetical protein
MLQQEQQQVLQLQQQLELLKLLQQQEQEEARFQTELELELHLVMQLRQKEEEQAMQQRQEQELQSYLAQVAVADGTSFQHNFANFSAMLTPQQSLDSPFVAAIDANAVGSCTSPYLQHLVPAASSCYVDCSSPSLSSPSSINTNNLTGSCFTAGSTSSLSPEPSLNWYPQNAVLVGDGFPYATAGQGNAADDMLAIRKPGQTSEVKAFDENMYTGFACSSGPVLLHLA